MKIAAAQIAPVWLNREDTIDKVVRYIEKSAQQEVELVAFGEAFVPGYPFWVALTDGARFESEAQKEMFAWYSREAVQVERGDLDRVSKAAKMHAISVVLGIIERPSSRGGHSLYCSLVMIDKEGAI
ncbi:MAG: nitrilase-related carbon-nitrogen hydrolase, partial [Bacteroidia bacterium]